MRKLNRDYKDLALIEDIQMEYTPFYNARKILLTELIRKEAE